MQELAALALALSLMSQSLPEEPAASVVDEVTVTATRTERRLADTAASVVVLSSEELETTAAGTVDDALRQVPGFSLFRRSGSRFANPTTQGVSLRGLGASGASRALVLADGIPLNDPFGGWIYWGRVPRVSLSRIEVLRGAGSDLYGSAALGGVVQLLSRAPSEPVLAFEAAYGERETPEGGLFVAERRGRWAASLGAEGFRTGGYVPVEPAARGAVDAPAASRHSTVDLTLERRVGEDGRAFLRGSWFDEERDNGTRLQVNDTTIRQASLGMDGSAGGGWLSLRAWGSDQDYFQTFTAVAPDRNSESLTREQRVPAESLGGSAQWTRTLGDRHGLVAGFDLREVSGTSDELVFPILRRTEAGGTQRTAGLFVEDLVSLTPRLSLTLGGRIDGWRNEGQEDEREETAFSPRASLLWRATDRWAWTASAYRGFRAPTLNELYRDFRVGDVLTLANDELEAERLSGGETGAIFSSSRVTARGVLFWMEVDRNVANVTLSFSPGLITRQRRNLGRTRSRGIEMEGTARLGDRWTLSGGYLLSDATVERASPDLEGLRIPQVPRHQGSLQLRFFDPQIVTAGLQARWTGEQFDDDRNELPLESFLAVDALLSRPVARGLEVFLAAENLLDEAYETGRTPVRSLGPPRTVRLGIRFEVSPSSLRRQRTAGRPTPAG
ncbi:MAG TPA: TonB-dependent receptor [Thermoanaerobaculia bacterium]|nr:TonB-dependent receptor [Thermoanaerobaculia bacterium]